MHLPIGQIELLFVDPPHARHKCQNLVFQVFGRQDDRIAVHKRDTAGESPGAQRPRVGVKVCVCDGFQKDPERVGGYLPQNGLAALSMSTAPLRRSNVPSGFRRICA